MARLKSLTPRLAAFLDTIAWSEIGPALLAVSDDGYNVCVGGAFFPSYAVHPRIRNDKLDSDAAGRYQLMGRYWLPYKQQLKLPDFSPESQDIIAVQLIRECHALGVIEAGRVEDAVALCRSRWASLPGAGYGQHENKLADLVKVFHDHLA